MARPEVVIELASMIFYLALIIGSSRQFSLHLIGQQQTEKTGAYTPQVIDLVSIDSAKNRFRLYRIIRRGNTVHTLHERSAPDEESYLKRAKSPKTFDSADEAENYVSELIDLKVSRRRDPYSLVESPEVVF
jgi:hypothetical protein